MLGQAAWETIPGVTQDALSALLSQSSFAEIDFGPLRTLTYADVCVFAAIFELRDAVLALGEITSRVLGAFPELKPAYDSWWAEQKEHLEKAFAEATRKDGWWMAASHL